MRQPITPATTSTIGFFQLLGLLLHIEKEEHFTSTFRSMKHTAGSKLSGSLFGGLQPGRRELLTRAKGLPQLAPVVYTRGLNGPPGDFRCASNGQGAKVSADHGH
jgi:hypothetical protein